MQSQSRQWCSSIQLLHVRAGMAATDAIATASSASARPDAAPARAGRTSAGEVGFPGRPARRPGVVQKTPDLHLPGDVSDAPRRVKKAVEALSATLRCSARSVLKMRHVNSNAPAREPLG